MALNWYLTLRNLAKTDENASELLQLLKKATTDEEKEIAKQQAQSYIQTLQSEEVSTTTPEEIVVAEDKPMVEEEVVEPSDEVVVEEPAQDESADSEEEPEKEEIIDIDYEKVKTDLSQPAFTPRLAKCGITREEELFLKGVMVRKMTREEKIALRRSIYQKKTQHQAKIQAEYKAKRIAKKEADKNDPVKQAYHRERKYVMSIVQAIESHKNLGWIFTNIDGLTPTIFRELIAKPQVVNAINQANPNFITNFNKKYGV